MDKDSINKLLTCEPILIEVISELDRRFKIVVECGYRDKSEQDKLYHFGESDSIYPASKHNSYPSQAIDIKSERISYSRLQKEFRKIANKHGLHYSWGGKCKYQRPQHFEIIKK